MATACDAVMECDAVVLLNEGVGDMRTTSEKDGQLVFDFPQGSKPAIKLTGHDCTVTPWLKQAVKGKIHKPAEVDSAGGAKAVYDAYYKNAADSLLNGENLVTVSYGNEWTRKNGLVIGDEKQKKGIIHHFIEDLFKSKDIDTFNVRLVSYSYNPLTERITDLICKEGTPELKDADAKRAGSDLVGLKVKCIDDTASSVEQLSKVYDAMQDLRNQELKAIELRAEQMSLRLRKTKDEEEVVDFDDDDGGKDTVMSYIPEPYYDNMLVVQVQVLHGDPSVMAQRKSANWGTCTFITLPDCARPEAVGALRADDVTRYEKVQRLLCAQLSVLTAIRLKRRRIPFLAHRFTSTLRVPYRQTGEREDELTLIKHASFRSKASGSPEGSPRFVGKEAGVTRSIVLMHLTEKGESVLENFHTFTCVKRFAEMSSSTTGLFSRHLQVEQAQMDREIASLNLQLEVAKQVHGFKPILCDSKAKGDKPIQEREAAALERRKDQIEQAEQERRKRIDDAASHIAERNIKEEKSRYAQVQQNHSNVVAKKGQLQKELDKWRNMSLADLNAEISQLTRELQAVENKGKQLETEQAGKQQTLAKKEKEMNNMTSAVAEKQKKALAEMERRKEEARAIAVARKDAVTRSIVSMRKGIADAGNTVKQQADALARLSKDSKQECQNVTAAIAGFESIADRLMPSDPTDQQLDRITAVRDRLMTGWAHEMVFLQRTLRDAGIPLPINPSVRPAPTVPLDAVRPVVRLHITIEGMTGVCDKREMKYSVAGQRHGKVLECPRVGIQGGTVEWFHTMKVATRLPPKGEQAVDLMTFSLTEFLPDGSLNESLPFDMDLIKLACKPTKQYVVMPGNESGIRISIHVRTQRVKPKAPRANPLATAQMVASHRESGIDYGPSSDEE